MVDINQFDPDKLINNVLPQLQSELRSIVGNGANSSKNIQALYALRLFANQYYTSLSREYDRFNAEAKQQADQIAEKQAVEAVRANANRILEIELEKAVQINTEFKHPVFYQPLVYAVYDPRTIQVTLVNGRISIKIDLNTTAGTLSDWANAVKAARRTIRGKKRKTPEPLRSHMWREKYYGSAREGNTITRTSKRTGKTTDITESYIRKYWDIVYTRMENSQSPAPYWHILNYGTPEAKQEVKDAGVAYPQNTRTDFVGKTINFLKSYYQKEYRIYYAKIESDIAIIQRKYLKRFEQWDNISSAIDRAIEKEERKANTGTSAPHDPLSAELLLVKERLGEDRFSRADPNRLRDLAEKLRKGEEINKRLSLGGGVTARTVRLVKIARGY